MKNLSLRTRIYLSMIALILFSFIITGAITTFRFNKQNLDYHENRLKRKERTVVQTIRFLIDKNEELEEPMAINDLLVENVTQIATITDLDINFFNFEGELLVSSHTTYFDEGIFVYQLSEDIREDLLSGEERIIEHHQADTLSILSAYRAISSANDTEKKIAFMNIPYFQTDEQLNNDLQGYLKTLTQVYGLFFILAALFAYFISNYITKSLKTIGEKLKATSFEKKNIPVDWKSDDEIGKLINEYNRMIGELENSANKLAKSERDAAWREMAKQVAHEIKNPLTPMKLNLQYLQRSIDDESADWKEKFKRSSTSLIEQIDTLSSIASAFSNFAQMPKSNMAEIDLKKIAESVVNLFSETEHIDLSVRIDPRDNYHMKGDKDQLSRMISNLLKNAIQAIPEENEGKIVVELMKKGFQMILSVEDNGKGIPEEEFDKIFVPNFTTKSTGMGLGLAMVKNIIENHKGKVWYTSTVGKGTVFYVSLPVNK